MTAVDNDGIDEDLTRSVSVAMLATARAGEQFSRMTEAAARQRQARAAGNTAQMQREIEAHTEAAKAYFEVVSRPEYLDVATDEQIREVARQAEAWRDRLPEAQRAADTVNRQLAQDKPVDVDERSAALAVEGDAADRRADRDSAEPGQGGDVSAPERPAAEDRTTERAGQEAVTTAEVAQARPAREAPASTARRSARRRAPRATPARTRSTGVER